MKDRLDKLRQSLGPLTWGELARELCISRSMLGFINTGAKNPGPKLSRRIILLETTLDQEDSSKQLVAEIALLWDAIADLRERLSRVADDSQVPAAAAKRRH